METKEKYIEDYKLNIKELESERQKLYEDLKDFKLDYYSTEFKLRRMDEINRNIKSIKRKIDKLCQ